MKLTIDKLGQSSITINGQVMYNLHTGGLVVI